jgi:hypothetical protein
MSRNMPPAQPRTSYRCAAWGCPNSGCINDDGEDKPGLCWQHFREGDRTRWSAVTAEILRTWPKLGNHRMPLPGTQPSADPRPMTAEEMF